MKKCLLKSEPKPSGVFHTYPLLTVVRGLALGVTICLAGGCDDFVNVEAPKTQIVSSTVFTDDATATAAVNAIYIEMLSPGSFSSGGLSSVTVLGGLSADELANYAATSTREEFHNNSLVPTNSIIKSAIWGQAYKLIYFSNAVLEGLDNGKGITESTKRQLQGEAKFIRAFCYFYLVNLFGDIPLLLTTDYRVNRIAPRSGSVKVYEHIISDLEEAILLLEAGSSGAKRIKPDQWAARALLSRVFLYNQDWVHAESEATAVIDGSGQFILEDDLSHVFRQDSRESIFQLKPIEPGLNTLEGNVFIPSGSPGSVVLSDGLAGAFEANDMRQSEWVGSIIANGVTYYFPYKYKVKSGTDLLEYSVVLRLAELYLIRAEARARQNKLADAISDLDHIRVRAGLTSIASASPTIGYDELFILIQKERRLELFSEWGHRWLDLKRLGSANTVLASVKFDWDVTDVLYPIPQSEIDNNPNCIQNEGY